MSGQSFVMRGHLDFVYNGQQQSAPAIVTITPLNKKQFSCNLEVTYGGVTHTARFNVAGVGPGKEEAERQARALSDGIRLAIASWPEPWSRVRSVVQVTLNLG